MNFLLTTFIYPLKEPLPLLDKLGFYWDNPRTDEEIEFVKKYLEQTHDATDAFRFPPTADEDIISIDYLVRTFRDALGDKDRYVNLFFKDYVPEMVFSFLAKMWVVIRFNDQGESLALRKVYEEAKQAGQHFLIILEDDHPIVRESNRLVDFSYLLALLIHTEGEDYFGRGFVIAREAIESRLQRASLPWWSLVLLGILSQEIARKGEIRDPLNWLFFPNALRETRRVIPLIEKAIANGDLERLLYVGNILRIVGEQVRDPRIAVVMLTSIIEMLVTHNPDFNRFNVEDSINKQFQLKASTLIYLNDRTRNIGHIRTRLKTIYRLRSIIAHGNFQDIPKFVRRFSQGKEDETSFIEQAVYDLYTYVRAILEEFLKDPALVNFMKDA